MELLINGVKINNVKEIKKVLNETHGDWATIKYVATSKAEAETLKGEENSPVINYYDGDKYVKSEKEFTVYTGYQQNDECMDILPNGKGKAFNLEKSQEYNFQQVVKILKADGIIK